MIIYELQCPLGHRFEGWFRNSEAFEAQTEADLVQCAVCGAGGVKRLAVGGHLQTTAHLTAGHQTPAPAPAVPTPDQPTAPTTAPRSTPPPASPRATPPEKISVDPVTLLKAIHHHVKTHYTDVGSNFADQALAMHRGETPMRAIYGAATVDGKTQLDDAGVEYLPLPVLPETVEN